MTMSQIGALLEMPGTVSVRKRLFDAPDSGIFF